jgi:glutamyl-tRNA synthetase
MSKEFNEFVRGRLAPSPTGALHLGNARSFLIAWLSVRSRGGSLLLRMEDLDHPKVKSAAAAQALEDLRWLGLDWDEGPDVGGPHAPYVQTQRIARYADALEKLRWPGRSAGGHLLMAQTCPRDGAHGPPSNNTTQTGFIYPCVCARRDVEAGQSAPHAGEDGLRYDGHCRDRFATYEEAAATLPPGRLPAWRFRVEPEDETTFDDGVHGPQRERVAETTGDFVIARHAQGAGYMLAVVVDDAAMGVNEVLRGDDLMPATHRQLLLYRALGLTPPRFVHVPLVVAPDGRRLAKRHGDTRIATLRQLGLRPEQIIGLLAWWSGWAKWGEELTLAELLSRYDLAQLPHQPVVLTDEIKKWLGIEK